MNKTALQQAIDVTKAKIESLEVLAEKSEKDKNYLERNICKREIEILSENVDIMEGLIEIEKEQIINDYCNGRMSVIERSVISADQYYNETYTNENT